MGRFVAWKMFVWTFENFKKSRSDNNFMKFSDLGFLDLFFNAWTCILGVWTCILGVRACILGMMPKTKSFHKRLLATDRRERFRSQSVYNSMGINRDL